MSGNSLEALVNSIVVRYRCKGCYITWSTNPNCTACSRCIIGYSRLNECMSCRQFVEHTLSKNKMCIKCQALYRHALQLGKGRRVVLNDKSFMQDD